MGSAHARLSKEKIREVQRLAQEGFSLDRISSMLNVGKSTIYYYAKPYCRKQTKLNLDALSLREQGYIIGMFVGDGNIIRNPEKGQYGIKITLDKLKDQDITDYLCMLIGKAGKKIQKRVEGSDLCLRTFSKRLVEFILTYVLVAKQSTSKRNIKSLVKYETWNPHFKLGFISGLIDSDGHIFHKKNKHYGAIIKTNNRLLAKQIQSIQESLGSNVSIHVHEFKGTYPTKSLCYDIYVPSKSFHRFCRNLISVKHSRYH